MPILRAAESRKVQLKLIYEHWPWWCYISEAIIRSMQLCKSMQLQSKSYSPLSVKVIKCVHSVPQPERCFRGAKFLSWGALTTLTTIFSYCRFGFGRRNLYLGGAAPWIPVSCGPAYNLIVSSLKSFERLILDCYLRFSL